jgi:hypothetical protein
MGQGPLTVVTPSGIRFGRKGKVHRDGGATDPETEVSVAVDTTRKLSGVFAPITTPFAADEEVDYSALVRPLLPLSSDAVAHLEGALTAEGAL